MVKFGSASISISVFYACMINWNLSDRYYLKYYAETTIQEELTLKKLVVVITGLVFYFLWAVHHLPDFQCNVLNISRGVFRTQSNIFDGIFLQK